MLSSWDDIRFLEALERRGSARAAGRELGVAPSTIYRRIAALETAAGFACLDRGKGITPAGRELAELARSTGSALEGIARKARARREEVRGTVTLTTIDGFAPLLVAPLAELAKSCPHLRVHVHIAESGGLSLRKRQAEVGITVLSDPPSSLVGRKLFPVRWGVYGSRTVAASPDAARWVTLAKPHDTTWLGRWEALHVPADRVAVATHSRRLLVDLVASGAGLGLLPARLADDVPELVEIPSYRPIVAELTRPAWLLMHAEARRDARVVAVTKALVEHMKG
jgi:DNA-binding transcriptional LysR family regulator